jgi:hypothetical protein
MSYLVVSVDGYQGPGYIPVSEFSSDVWMILTSIRSEIGRHHESVDPLRPLNLDFWFRDSTEKYESELERLRTRLNDLEAVLHTLITGFKHSITDGSGLKWLIEKEGLCLETNPEDVGEGSWFVSHPHENKQIWGGVSNEKVLFEKYWGTTPIGGIIAGDWASG